MATTLAQKIRIRELVLAGVKAADIAQELHLTLRTTRKWIQVIKKGAV